MSLDIDVSESQDFDFASSPFAKLRQILRGLLDVGAVVVVAVPSVVEESVEVDPLVVDVCVSGVAVVVGVVVVEGLLKFCLWLFR